MPVDGFSLPNTSLYCFLIFTVDGFQHFSNTLIFLIILITLGIISISKIC